MGTNDQVILSTGANAELLWLREHVLRSAGFKVITTSNESTAIAEMQNGNCAVLLMCHSLSDALRGKLSKEFRKRCPRGQIIGITNVPWPQARDEVNLYVLGVEGPEALINAVRTGRIADRSDAA